MLKFREYCSQRVEKFYYLWKRGACLWDLPNLFDFMREANE